ncbi:MAG: PHB depolymerase family esterase [Bacteroidota bacterium]
MLKTNLVLLLLLGGSFSLLAQQTLNESIWHDGSERTYIIYVPESYSPSEPAPLVFNLHGYTGNGQQQMGYGDFRPIADTAGFLLVHPTGLRDGSGLTHWNADWGTGVNDINFFDVLIDSLATNYNVDERRIYSTGMSNGGYMSYTLICRLSDRIAAAASVTGSMTIWQITNASGCTPDRPKPVMQIHGTADNVVPYSGNTWSAGIENVLQYWINHNHCDLMPDISSVPNSSTNDASTVQHLVNANGDNGVEVEFYKVFNGGHTWPGSSVISGVTNQDFDASEKIWQFFSRYDIDGRVSDSGATSIDAAALAFSVSPNPFQDIIRIRHQAQLRGDILVFNLMGEKLGQQASDGSGVTELSLEHLPVGIYGLFLSQPDQGIVFVGKLVKQSHD